MPTIEIVSVNAKNVNLNQSKFDIAIIEENKLIGHRGLFDKFLADKHGTMVHLGNPEFKDNKEGCFFANAIINWDFEPNYIEIPNFDKGETGANQDFKFKFEITYQIEIANLLFKALECSPSYEAYFMTDYQFGPEEPEFKDMKLSEFWENHDKVGLNWNTLYILRKE
ncbi:hypothetical protein [Marinifilum flexuosum]|uniref:hypothetical protein n=1 Tax=Marinifilum flexuosum TaxID=1117708 RepID=UPI00249376D1|nr:hypothetical protein [Marinifilum flexuosum]